jgi:hypothetical protein
MPQLAENKQNEPILIENFEPNPARRGGRKRWKFKYEGDDSARVNQPARRGGRKR